MKRSLFALTLLATAPALALTVDEAQGRIDAAQARLDDAQKTVDDTKSTHTATQGKVHALSGDAEKADVMVAKQAEATQLVDECNAAVENYKRCVEHCAEVNKEVGREYKIEGGKVVPPAEAPQPITVK